MIDEINLNEPKTTGVAVQQTADFVKLNTSKKRKYLEIINTSDVEVQFAIGENEPAAKDYVRIAENGHWAVGHPEFFSSVDSIKLWLKATNTTNIVLVS